MKFRKRLIYSLVVIIFAILVTLLYETGNFLISYFFEKCYLIMFSVRVIFALLGVIIFLSVLLRSDNHSTKMPWIIFIFLNPVLGVIIFLTFSNNYRHTLRYRKRKNELDGYNYIKYEKLTDGVSDESLIVDENISSNITDMLIASKRMSGHPVYYGDSTVENLENGDEFFPKLIEKIKEAKDYIFMLFYIIKSDEIGKEVLATLKEKAEKGVKVVLIYDGLGSIRVSKKTLKALKDSGVEVLAFDKVIFPLFNSKINNRNHRKITLIDGKYGFVGGTNLGDEYIHRSRKYGFWRDNHIMIEGPAINSLLEVFNKDYYYITGKFLDVNKYVAKEKKISNYYVHTIQSGPESKFPIIRDIYIKMINSARKSIKLMSPYLILDQAFLNALKTASRSNVDVKLIIPGKADKQVVYKCSESFIETLTKAGVEVHKYKNLFTHSKIMIIDDEIASCGTFNLDIRSFLIDFEVTTLFTGERVKELAKSYDLDLLKCEKIEYEIWKKRSFIRKLVEGIVNIFAPVM